MSSSQRTASSRSGQFTVKFNATPWHAEARTTAAARTDNLSHGHSDPRPGSGHHGMNIMSEGGPQSMPEPLDCLNTGQPHAHASWAHPHRREERLRGRMDALVNVSVLHSRTLS